MGALLVLLTLGLAFANGANDVSKGIATLVGSGTTEYRAAVAWGTAWTLAGGLAAAFFSQGLVATFSGKGLLVNPPGGNALSPFGRLWRDRLAPLRESDGASGIDNPCTDGRAVRCRDRGGRYVRAWPGQVSRGRWRCRSPFHRSPRWS